MSNLIKDFIIFSSGAKKDVLQRCKEKGYNEDNKFITVGITVILTGIFAAIAGGYAIHRVFINEDGGWQYALGFALLWGLMIYNLDRFIVQGIDKTSSWWRQLLISTPRIILAIIISIVISKPLEVKLFSDRLAYEIRETKIYTDSLTTMQIENNNDISGKNEAYNNANASYEQAKEKAANLPTSSEYLNLKSQYKICDDALYKLKYKINYPKIRTIKLEIAEIEGNTSNYKIVDGNKEFYVGAKNRLDKLASERARLNREVSRKDTKCSDIDGKIIKIEDEYKKLWKGRVSEYEQQRDTAQSILTTSETVAAAEISDTREITKKSFTDNFISQLEALGRLTEKDETFRLINLFVILLFIMVETTPVFIKLFQTVDMYDEELAMTKKKYKFKIQKEFEAFVRDEEEAFKLETEANERIVSKLADAQVEVAEAVIDDWKTEEIEKTKE